MTTNTTAPGIHHASPSLRARNMTISSVTQIDVNAGRKLEPVAERPLQVPDVTQVVAPGPPQAERSEGQLHEPDDPEPEHAEEHAGADRARQPTRARSARHGGHRPRASRRERSARAPRRSGRSARRARPGGRAPCRRRSPCRVVPPGGRKAPRCAGAARRTTPRRHLPPRRGRCGSRPRRRLRPPRSLLAPRRERRTAARAARRVADPAAPALRRRRTR